MRAEVFDPRPCALGEGALWHPLRGELYWFDILGRRLLTRSAPSRTKEWRFHEMCSAAGWIDRDRLLIASETRLFTLHLETDALDHICGLEEDEFANRSNDGRADPCGGFWIGTMGKRLEREAGAIYRFYKGELRRLLDRITIANAICFAPDGRTACFADTALGKVWRVALDAEGWPIGAPEVYLDLKAEGLNPDGAVIDAQGRFWVAQWGASRVAAYGPDGAFLRAVDIDAPQASCPAFGGSDLSDLYCTSAAEGLPAPLGLSGQTFVARGVGARGQYEHRVIL